MFSKSILSDPYFHNDHNEQTAREALHNAGNENFLFCPGKKENEILLVYKAEYNQQNQVRTINLNYYDSDDSIDHNSLGEHATLHSVSQALIKFLNGWTTKAFTPIPFIKAFTANEPNS